MRTTAISIVIFILVVDVAMVDWPQFCGPTVLLAEWAAGNEWEQVFRAGMVDRATGRPIRGTEIVHLVAHQGHLYAGNGYWMDTRGYANIPWAQVIVLDSPEGEWIWRWDRGTCVSRR